MTQCAGWLSQTGRNLTGQPSAHGRRPVINDVNQGLEHDVPVPTIGQVMRRGPASRMQGQRTGYAEGVLSTPVEGTSKVRGER